MGSTQIPRMVAGTWLEQQRPNWLVFEHFGGFKSIDWLEKENPSILRLTRLGNVMQTMSFEIWACVKEPYPSVDESLFKRQDRLPLQSLELRRIDPEVLRLGREEVRLLGGDDDDVEQVLPVFAQHVLHALMSKQ